MTVGVNKVEEALTPFGVAGRGSWLAPRCERTVVKCVNIGNVEDYPPPPGPAPPGRLGDEVEIARPCSKAGEYRLFAAMQDLKPQRAVESDSSWHFVGAQCDRADPLDHGQLCHFISQCRRRRDPNRKRIDPTTHCRKPFAVAMAMAREPSSASSTFLLRLYAAEQPRAVLVGWDSLGAPTKRHEIFSAYQSGREFDDALIEQLNVLPEFVAACGFANAKAPGFEADDFLAAAVAAEERADGAVLVASGDRDAFQRHCQGK